MSRCVLCQIIDGFALAWTRLFRAQDRTTPRAVLSDELRNSAPGISNERAQQILAEVVAEAVKKQAAKKTIQDEPD